MMFSETEKAESKFLPSFLMPLLDFPEWWQQALLTALLLAVSKQLEAKPGFMAAIMWLNRCLGTVLRSPSTSLSTHSCQVCFKSSYKRQDQRNPHDELWSTTGMWFISDGEDVGRINNHKRNRHHYNFCNKYGNIHILPTVQVIIML